MNRRRHGSHGSFGWFIVIHAAVALLIKKLINNKNYAKVTMRGDR
jgi:hypothetical protein